MTGKVSSAAAWIIAAFACVAAAVAMPREATALQAPAAEPRRDEFGRIPDDAEDKDLTLPDPILDRTWPGPKPGEGDEPPPHVAPDEDSTDPFEDKDAPPVDDPSYVPPEAPAPAAPRPPRPMVGPDGKLDPGTPVPVPSRESPDALAPDPDDPSEIEKDEARPSPLDEEEQKYDKEEADPEEW